MKVGNVWPTCMLMSSVFVLCSSLASAQTGQAQTAGSDRSQMAASPSAAAREDFTAFAVNMSNVGRTGGNTVQISIERWSTDDERDMLMNVFKEKGPEALLSALQKLPRVGFIRTPNSVGYDLHFARRMSTPGGGERIVIATDRRIGFWEAANRPRSIDYPFTLIEMRVNANGEGEGKLSVATKVTMNERDNTIELENYASEPVRLQNVRRTTR